MRFSGLTWLALHCMLLGAVFSTGQPTGLGDESHGPIAETTIVPFPHVQWPAKEGVETYQIQWAVEPSFAAPLIDDRLAACIHWFTCSRQLDAGRYYWRVRGLDANGNPITSWDPVAEVRIIEPETSFQITPATSVAEIRRMAVQASKAGSARIVFQAGEYRLDPGFDKALFAWEKASNILIDGSGATIHLMDPSSQLVKLDHCQHIVIRNLTLNHEPMPYSELTVSGVDLSTGSFSARIRGGFDGVRYVHDVNQMFMYVLDPENPRRPHPGRPGHVYLNPQKTQDIGPGERRFFVRDQGEFDSLRQLQPDDHALVIYRQWPQNWVRQCTDVTFESYRVGHSEGALFMGGGNEAMKFLNLHSDPPAGVFPSGPAWVTGNDRLGPWIENYAATGMSDDGPNITGNSYLIASAESRDTFVLATRSAGPGWQNPQWRSGDRLIFWSPTTGMPLAEVAVRESIQRANGDTQIRVSAPVEGLEAGLDRMRNTHVYNLSSCNNQLVIRNCRLVGGRRFGFNIKAIGALIERNSFEGQASSALYFENEPSGWEGLINRDIVVQDNEFRDVGLNDHSIRVHRAVIHVNTWKNSPRIMAETPWIGNYNLVIRRNKIHDREGIAIGVDNAAHVRIEDNVIDASENHAFHMGSPIDNAAIAIFGRTEVVQLKDNAILDPRPGYLPIYREK